MEQGTSVSGAIGSNPETGTGGTGNTGSSTYVVCEYYTQDVLWVSIVCDANEENCSISNIEVLFSVIYEDCYEVTVNHTETPDGDSPYDTGDGAIPILDPNECEIIEFDLGIFVNTCEEGGEDELIEWLELNAGFNACELALAIQFPLEAYRMYKNKPIAEAMTEDYFGGNGRNDCSDAFRHAFLNAINSRDTYSAVAQAFGEAHECDTPESAQQEKVMDLFNNNVGNQIGVNNKNATNDQIAQLVAQALIAGEMKVFETPSNPLSPLISSEICQ